MPWRAWVAAVQRQASRWGSQGGSRSTGQPPLPRRGPGQMSARFRTSRIGCAAEPSPHRLRPASTIACFGHRPGRKSWGSRPISQRHHIPEPCRVGPSNMPESLSSPTGTPASIQRPPCARAGLRNGEPLWPWRGEGEGGGGRACEGVGPPRPISTTRQTPISRPGIQAVPISVRVNASLDALLAPSLDQVGVKVLAHAAKNPTTCPPSIHKPFPPSLPGLLRPLSLSPRCSATRKQKRRLLEHCELTYRPVRTGYTLSKYCLCLAQPSLLHLPHFPARTRCSPPLGR